MGFARSRAWLFPLAFIAFVPIPPFAYAAVEPPPTTLAIDGSHSDARFIVHLRLGMRTEGRLTKVGGELQGDATQGWTVLVTADGRSLRVSGPRWMDRATRSDAFLAVDRHPDIRFRSDRFSDALLHRGGRIRGQLTLRGLTRTVSFRLLPSACADPGRDCDLQVHGSLSRKAFGMTAHRAAVKDIVELHMSVRLHPAGPAAQ